MSANAVEPNAGKDEIDLIWGAKAIGARLNLSPREAFYQLEAGRIPGARQWGRKWSASGAVLRRVLSGEPPPIDA
jgi:hypothetical protein